jgi:osmoprotectant transport system permease protein
MPSTDLQLDWLRAFVAAVDAGSLTAAGALVHRSQSALSMQIAKLEQAVGQAVLVRTPRRLDLTPAGRELLGHARRLIAQHDEAVQALRRETLHGRLTIGVPEDYALPYLTPVLRDFAGRHTAVELTLVCQQSTVLIPRVTRGEVDVAVVTRDRAGRGQALFDEPLAWFGAPRFEAWRQTPLPVAVYESGSLARKAALTALSALKRPHRIVCDSASPAGMLAAVESGLAIALFTRCSVPEGMELLDERHGMPPATSLPAMSVVLMRSRASAGSAAADAFAGQVLCTLARSRTGSTMLRRRLRPLLLLLVCAALTGTSGAWAADPLRIGSKRFTESYILAEVLAQTVRADDPSAKVEIRQGLGNTAIVHAALKAGSIDVYPEYLGTIEREILGHAATGAPLDQLQAELRPLGLAIGVPLGFNNGYALAMRSAQARELGVTALSQLKGQPALKLGLSNEFLGRADGWPGLSTRYAMPQQPTGLDHGLAYHALADAQIDVTDVYTTDAQIAALDLTVLTDDGRFFPRYDAVLLYRLDLPQRQPRAWAALQTLRGRIDEAAMIAMNAQAEVKRQPFDAIARAFLASRGPASAPASTPSSAKAEPAQPARSGVWSRLTGPDLGRLTLQHLALVLGAVALATLVGVPLAVALHPWPRWRESLLAICALLQTVPSLAMLALLIWAMDRIGPVPAMVALTLYALLPVLRNCTVGLSEVSEGLTTAAKALGLTRGQVLRSVQLPLALPVMLAGLRTATSLSVGTATMAAFIGAGGYGERIVTGLALNDQTLLLAGALPAAALALLFEGVFGLMAWRLARSRGA